MRKLLAVSLVLLLGAPAFAQDIECTVSNLTPLQTAKATIALEDINAERANVGLAPLATIADAIEWAGVQYLLARFAKVAADEAAAVGAAAVDHGTEIAPAGHCAAAGLEAGCMKSEVACFVLDGTTDCSG